MDAHQYLHAVITADVTKGGGLMAAEYSANALQTVAPGGSVIFTESPVPCKKGFIYHRDESGLFRLASNAVNDACCKCNATYEVAFHANIQVPADGTVEPISLAVVIDGEADPSSTMIYVPAAVEELGNVGAELIVSVPWICRCSSVSIRNTSTQPIQVQNANIVIER